MNVTGFRPPILTTYRMTRPSGNTSLQGHNLQSGERDDRIQRQPRNQPLKTQRAPNAWETAHKATDHTQWATSYTQAFPQVWISDFFL